MDRAPIAADAGPRPGGAPLVTIYTADDCHWCVKAKKYLQGRGVPYTEKNVQADEATEREVVALSGQRGVPVITVGPQVIVGFQRGKLDALLGLGAPDAATEAALPPAQDASAAAAAAVRVVWTPAQEAGAAAFAALVDPRALCAYLGPQLDFSPTNCDHTFRYLGAYLAAHPVAGTEPAALLALLGPLGIHCDCGYAVNVCMR